jgi:hypothetical protein
MAGMTLQAKLIQVHELRELGLVRESELTIHQVSFHFVITLYPFYMNLQYLSVRLPKVLT